MKLSEIGELSLLKQIRRRFGVKAKNILTGIGDDTAVIKPSGGNMLMTTDMMVEGVHFDLNFTAAYQLGFKLVSVNVSDIYAMAGKPQYLLLDIAMNKNTEQKFVKAFFDGIHDAIKLYGVALIGGDISSSKKDMAIAATLIGEAERPVKRSGAKPGDKIYVTGNLGDSACGLEILKRAVRCQVSGVSKKPTAAGYRLIAAYKQKGLTWNMISPLIQRHLMPVARKPKGFAKYATSMIDLSDGLFIDLSRLCDESRVGAKIFTERIPVSGKMRSASSLLGLDAMKLACSGGEDYELLFTAPSYPPSPPLIRGGAGGVKITCIGEITKRSRIVVHATGRESQMKAEGYQHFEISG